MAREATDRNALDARLRSQPSHSDSDGPMRHTPSHLLLTGDWADYRRSQAAWAAHWARLREVIAAQQNAPHSTVTVADDRLISSYWEGWQEGVARRLAAAQEARR